MASMTPHIRLLLTLAILFLCQSNTSAQNVTRYDLYVHDTMVNYAGKERRAIAVNGQIPMPTLSFTEGDIAEIHVHNRLKEGTSLHWHGVFLPNKEDGVPYLTQMPIAPGKTHVYRFPVIQSGTHWYHSHSGLQEQIGMYGSFIMHKRTDDPNFRAGIDDLPEIPLMLSEWTNYDPDNINRMLHYANDWAAIRKNAVQSYGEAIVAGHFRTKLANEWKRMLAMDVSDVYYDKILINGKATSEIISASGKKLKAGDKLRLRVSNGGASSYFWLNYAGGKITVVASDGNDVEPVEVDRLIIAVSETYDIVVTIPENDKSYELLATTEDRTNAASVFIGNGTRQHMARLPRLKYFEGMKMMNGMMKMNGDLDDMGMNMSLNRMDMNAVMYPEITGDDDRKLRQQAAHKDHHKGSAPGENEHMHNSNAGIVTLNYAMLKSPVKTTLPDKAVRELHFELTGNMNRYVWSMDNRILSETDKIRINKGEVVRMVIHNNSMMRHPMHIHGFDFRVLNGKGGYAPLKNVLDIMPMETDTVEFAANTEGDWFFHCHILYHMMSGMNRVISVGNEDNPLLPDKKRAYKMLQHESNMIYFTAQNDFATNGNDGEFMFQNARWSLGTEWRLGYNNTHGYETETHFGRYIGKMQWFMPFIGFDWRYRTSGIDGHEKNLFGQKNTKDHRGVFSAGFSYTLPMFIQFQSEIFTDGIVRIQLEREDIPLAKRLRGALMINTDKEYMVGTSYIFSKNFSARLHYDSDMGLGLGLNVRY